MGSLGNQCIEHLIHHKAEIIWALIFAIFFCFPAAIWALKFFETKKGKQLDRLTESFTSWLKLRISSERKVSEAEIGAAIRSAFPNQIPTEFVADQIYKNGALTWNKNAIYMDCGNKYLFRRRLFVLPLINGKETFFREACKCLASEFGNIDTSNNFLFVYLNKETNRLFKDEFVGQNFPGRIHCHQIVCDESKTEPGRMDLKYEMGESLSGFRIVLLECFLLVPDTINSTVNWLQNQGATMEGVASLFVESEAFSEDNACGISHDKVKVAFFVDLKRDKYLLEQDESKNLIEVPYIDY